MSFLNQINIAVTPFIGRSNKAIDFYNRNKYQNNKTGNLFLVLANGLEDWDTQVEEKLPSLKTMELDSPFEWIRYSKMFFVKSDIDGKINVGNLSWSQVAYGTDEETYFRNVRNCGSRWIYLEFKTDDDTFIPTIDNSVRQLGIYSDVTLTESSDPSKTVFLSENIKKVEDTLDNRNYEGILTLIQNTEIYEAKPNSTYNFILEF